MYRFDKDILLRFMGVWGQWERQSGHVLYIIKQHNIYKKLWHYSSINIVVEGVSSLPLPAYNPDQLMKMASRNVWRDQATYIKSETEVVSDYIFWPAYPLLDVFSLTLFTWKEPVHRPSVFIIIVYAVSTNINKLIGDDQTTIFKYEIWSFRSFLVCLY